MTNAVDNRPVNLKALADLPSDTPVVMIRDRSRSVTAVWKTPRGKLMPLTPSPPAPWHMAHWVS